MAKTELPKVESSVPPQQPVETSPKVETPPPPPKVASVEETSVSVSSSAPPSKNGSEQPKGTSYMESLGGNSKAKAKPSSYSPFGTKPKTVVTTTPWWDDKPPAVPVRNGTPQSPAPEMNKVNDVSYMDNVVGNDTKPPPVIPSSYSPFGQAPQKVQQSSSQNDSLYTPPTPNQQQQQTTPTQPQVAEQTGPSYVDSLIPEDKPAVLPSSYSPFGDYKSNSQPPPQSNGVSQQQQAEKTDGGTYLNSIGGNDVRRKETSYSPYGKKAQGRPWWKSPPSSS